MPEVATFASGCFWCTEAIFSRLNGVLSVTPGYSGGHTPHPTYSSVHSLNTGHAECLQIEFAPQIISYSTLLEVFFATHDPTTLNRQDNDIGSQYRSAIFYHTPLQQQLAHEAVSNIPNAVTEIVPFTVFYPAEPEHYNYYSTHSTQPYCSLVIQPKIAKLVHKFPQLLRPTS
jgi:peptide-methionine (S)-S-oxide reductase